MNTVNKGALIGRGRTAEVFAWGQDQVLKLYLAECPPAWVDYEHKIARLVQGAGLPAPAVGELVEIDGRRGLVYQRISGPSMLTALRAKPWQVLRYGRLMAEMHAAMHACPAPDLPAGRDKLMQAINTSPRLDDRAREAAIAALERLPDGAALCHGDFHPDNIVMSPRGPVVLDWVTSARAHPLADVARTSLMLRLGEPPPGMPGRWLINLIRGAFHAAYLGRYRSLRSVAQADVDAWLLPTAAARTNEDIPPERQNLQALIASLVST
jgi:aminoglycoside phosphotransferase (APT) family kinase protein